MQYGNRRSNSGERHPNHKLTVDQVSQIRRLARRGMSYRRIALIYGISHTEVGNIVHRQAWRHPVRAGDPVCGEIEL